MKIVVSSPSNIALVKYWGKHGNQLPNNPSISFTLKNSRSFVELEFENGNGNHVKRFDGREELSFFKKLDSFISKNDELSFLKKLDINLNSYNTFPHSTGIASSASSMSAYALAFLAIKEYLNNNTIDLKDNYFLEKVSSLSRRGSGSACRSLFPKVASWGKSDCIKDSSNEFATNLSAVLHSDFLDVQDSILIVSKLEKEVSSTLGHSLMEGHPFAEERYNQAKKNTKIIKECLENGNWDKFIEVVECEALTLHGLMMASTPSYTLLRPNTLAIVEKIKSFRRSSGLPICFTLDAGPNVHLLYKKLHLKKVMEFINTELLHLTEGNTVIHDELGDGARIEEAIDAD